ncbi:hypothetical protein D9619_005104 [Psilocybe cf. subviscida]|uniref:Uncharacterized protein n=1 Tax=Psilocybe cf. subviscida TaxID=2480587 RepID=A0A8H5F7P2_9AGAR|nr:hypothetical protein D9619_005104 [Psilocybe cf. subviscida]
MLVPSQHTFACASCAAAIAPTDPRVRCLVCTVPCDMCATCVLGERFREPHVGTHAVQVLKQSGGGGDAASGDGAALVPTVLGSTAICYYPPPPVPALPQPVVGEERTSVGALEGSVAQLSLGPERESVGMRGMVEPDQGANGVGHIEPPSVQAPAGQEYQHQLGGGGEDPNSYTSPPATQPPVEHHHNHYQYQQDVSAAFSVQDQAARVHHPNAGPPQFTSQHADYPHVADTVPPTYQHTSPIASPPVDPSHQADHPAVAPTVPTYHYDSPAPNASLPQPSSQPADQLPIATAGPPTYHHASPVASPPIGASQPQADQPPTPVRALPHIPGVASPPPGPGFSQQVDEPHHGVGAAPPVYQPQPLAPVVESSEAGSVQQAADHPPVGGAHPSTYHHAAPGASTQSPAGSFQQAADQSPVVAAIPATYWDDAAPAVSSPAPSFQQQKGQYGGAAAPPTYPHAGPFASSQSPPADYSRQVNQQPPTVAGAGPPTYHHHGAPIAAPSPAGSFQQADHPSNVVLSPRHTSNVASPAPGSFQQADQPPVDVAAPPTYEHAAPATSPAGSYQQVGQQPGVAATHMPYQYPMPVGPSPGDTSQQQGAQQQPVVVAASKSAYQYPAPVASSSVGSSVNQQPNGSAAAYHDPRYQYTAPGAPSPMGSSQHLGQQPVVPLPYQHAASIVSSPASSFQQVTQQPAVPSPYQHAAPIAASPAGAASQQANQLPAGAAAPQASPYQHAAPVASPPAGSYQQMGRPPSVAAAYAAYHYGPPQPTGSPAIPPNFTGSPSTPPNFTGTPPAVPPRRATGTGRPSSFNNSPHPAPQSNLPQYQNGGYQEAPAQATGWQPFLLADMSPSPTFVTLVNDVFSYLDQRNLGNLEPEVFSGFLDDLGYMPHENAWKLGLQPTYALSAQSMADKSLKNAFDLFAIDHVLLKRIQPPHEDPTGLTAQYKRVLGAAFNPAMLQQNPGAAHSTVEGPMPAITRKGFLQIMALEALGEPARSWGNWSRLLRKYNMPRYAGWGDLPRACFLECADPATMRRVEEIRKVSERRGQEQLDAARAYSQIAAQGRQNALDLVGNVRHEYVYR